MARTIAVDTNDPTRPHVTLTVRVSVLASVMVLPRESVHLTNLRRGMERASLIIRRDPSESGEVALSGVQSSAEWISARVRRLDTPEAVAEGLPHSVPGDWLLEIDLTAAPPYGRSQQKVRFKTGLPRQPEVELPLLVDLRPPVNLPSDRLLLPAAAEGEVATHTLSFSLRNGVDPSGLSVEGEPETLDVEVDRSGPRGWQALVRWPEDGRQEGRITFRAGDETQSLPVIRGPVRPGAED